MATSSFLCPSSGNKKSLLKKKISKEPFTMIIAVPWYIYKRSVKIEKNEWWKLLDRKKV